MSWTESLQVYLKGSILSGAITIGVILVALFVYWLWSDK